MAFAVLLGISGYASRNVTTDFRVEQFFPVWDPARTTYEEYKQHFTEEASLFILFWEEDHGLNTAVYHDMRRAAALMEASGLTDVTWLGNIKIVENVREGAETVLASRELIDSARLSDAYLASTLRKYRDDLFLKGSLWNPSQQVYVISGKLPAERDTDEIRRITEHTLSRKIQALHKPGRTLHLNGVPVLRAKFLTAMQRDQGIFLPVALLISFLILFFYFRNLQQVFLSLFAVLPAYVYVLALHALFGKPITILTSVVPLIILLVGLTDTIHILTHYRQIRLAQVPRNEAIITAFAELWWPCLLTAVTVAIGFLSLLSTGIGIIMEFGAFTAAGIFICFLNSIILFPILLSFSRREHFNNRGIEHPFFARFINRCIAISRTRAKTVVLVFTVLVLVCISYTTHLRVNAFLIEGLKENHPLTRECRWIEDKGFALFHLNLFLEGSPEFPIVSLENLQWMERFQRFVAQEDLVAGSLSLADQIKYIRKKLLDDQPGADRLPMTQAEVSQLMLTGELARPDFFEDLYLPGEEKAQITVRIKDVGSARTWPFLQRIEAFLKQNPGGFKQVRPTGVVQLAQAAYNSTIRGFTSSLFIAYGLIFAIMFIIFRSLKLAVIALIPNLIPVFFLLGIMGLLGMEIKPTTVLAFSIVDGIAVDDTIHLMTTLQRHLSLGKNLEQSMLESLHECGSAILVTSMVLILGFAVLMLAAVEALYVMGLLTAVALLTAVFADQLLLPAVMYILNKRNDGAEAPLSIS